MGFSTASLDAITCLSHLEMEHVVNDLNKLVSVAIQANDVFNKLYDESQTFVGKMQESLRAADVNSSAAIIDCLISQQRITLIIRDDIPGVVATAIGRKNTQEFEMLEQFNVNDLTVNYVLEIMEKYFPRK